MLDNPPAIIFPLAGQACVVVGGDVPVIGIYNELGQCVLSDPYFFRPAENFDLSEAAKWGNK